MDADCTNLLANVQADDDPTQDYCTRLGVVRSNLMARIAIVGASTDTLVQIDDMHWDAGRWLRAATNLIDWINSQCGRPDEDTMPSAVLHVSQQAQCRPAYGLFSRGYGL